MAKPALDDLYDLMNDFGAGIPNRLRAAVAASRVEPLSMPGEDEPQAIAFLRSIVACEHAGLMFHHNYRREAAQALAYWERRCKKAELQYSVADADEKRESWRRIINGGIRHHLWLHKRWPADKHILLTASDEFEVPDTDPDLVLSAVLLGGGNRHERRRLKAIDERLPGVWSGTEAERLELLEPLVEAMRQRLAQFPASP